MTKNFLKRGAFALLFTCLFSLRSISVAAQSSDEVINASYFVVFGRYASSGELTHWRANLGSRTIQQMVNLHQEYLNANQYEREQTVRRSYLDAFGWNPSNDELRYWSSQKKNYAFLMSNHINNWLNLYKDKKELVIKQSYYKVFNRTATPDEVRYWMGQPTYSFVQLVAMHTTWKQANQASSSVTRTKPNLNTNGISTAPLSQQAYNGVIAAGGGNVVAGGGGNVIAAGGGNVVSAGGGN